MGQCPVRTGRDGAAADGQLRARIKQSRASSPSPLDARRRAIGAPGIAERRRRDGRIVAARGGMDAVRSRERRASVVGSMARSVRALVPARAPRDQP